MLEIDLKLWDICFCIPWRFLNLLQPISRHVSGESFSRPTKSPRIWSRGRCPQKPPGCLVLPDFWAPGHQSYQMAMARWGVGQDLMANLGYLSAEVGAVLRLKHDETERETQRQVVPSSVGVLCGCSPIMPSLWSGLC